MSHTVATFPERAAYFCELIRSFFTMNRTKLAAFLICSMTSALAAGSAAADGDSAAEWRTHSKEPNGDVHFFDPSRVKQTNNSFRVWNRIRYKTSVMGAASYQSLLEIDCTERTEKIVQNTFFSDKHWKEPAMSTDKAERPKRAIAKGSASERLSEIICNQ